MPVDRGIGIERVGDIEAHILAFLEADERARHAAVDCDPVPFSPLHRARAVADSEIDHCARHLIEAYTDRRAAAHTVDRVTLRPSRHGGESRDGSQP